MSKRAGYVYLMERTKGRGWYGALTGQSEVKIGLSVRPARRLEEVNESLSGRTVIIAQVSTPNMKRTESFLHDLFADSRFRQKKAGRGAGRTEWFYMTWAELATALLWFKWLNVWYRIKYPLYLLIISFFIGLWLWIQMQRHTAPTNGADYWRPTRSAISAARSTAISG